MSDLKTVAIVRRSMVIAVESLAHDSGRTSVPAEGISKHQQIMKKPAATALNTTLASAHTETAYQ
jgi:hypothetical protein